MKFKPIRNRGIVCRKKTMLLDAREYFPDHDRVTILSRLRQRGRTWLVCRPFWFSSVDKRSIGCVTRKHAHNAAAYMFERARRLAPRLPTAAAALAFGRFSGARHMLARREKRANYRPPASAKVNGRWRKQVRAIGKAQRIIARRTERSFVWP